MKKWNLVKLVGVAGVALALAGCPELALKGVIRGLASPANVGSLKVTNGGSRQFLVTWKDPADSDLDHIEISLQSPFSTDTPPAPVSVPLGVQKATVTTPFNSVQYVVIVKSVDKAGNKSKGAVFGNISLQGSLSLPSTQAPVQQIRRYSDSNLTTITSGFGFHYNPDGTISQKDTLTGSGLTLNGYTTYTYVSGLLTTESNFNSLSVLQSYYSYLYDSNGNQTEKDYYDLTLSSRDVFEYDANGNQTRDSHYSGTGTLQYFEAFGYDSNNRIVSLEEGSVKLTFTWDPSTNFLSRADFYISGTLAEYITWQITPGQQMTETIFDSSGTPSQTQTDSYDSHGFLQQTPNPSTPDNSYPGGPSTFTYDINGNLSTEKDQDSTPAFYQGWGWTY